MSVEAVIAKGKKDFKGKDVIKAQSYMEAKSSAAATHIKLINGAYEAINDKLIIYRRDGDDVVEVNYSEIYDNPEGDYFVNNIDSQGQSVEIKLEPQLYSQVVLMDLNPNGNFYRCTDGRYIHKDEIQIPAYKKVEITDGNLFTGPVRDGEFYVGAHDDAKNRKYISHVKIGDKIVDIGPDENGKSKVKHNEDGTSSIKVGNEEIQLTERDVFIDKSAGVVFKETAGETISTRFYPNDAKKAKDLKPNGKKQIDLSFNEGDIQRIYVSGGETECHIEFKDGHKEIYLAPGKELRKNMVIGPNDRIFRVDVIGANFVEDEKGYEGYACDIKFSGKVEVDKEDVNVIVDDFANIKDVKWEFDANHNVSFVKSYKIGNQTITDIKWEDNKMVSFTITNEDGSQIKVDDIEKNEQYKHLTLKAIPAQEVNDVEFKDGDNPTVSFKMGDIEIVDAEIMADKGIGKCTLIYQGKTYKTDLQKDEKFKALSTQVAMIVKSDIIPLAPSKLMEKIDGKYKVVADVVQQGPVLTESEWANLSDEERAKLIEKGVTGPGVCGAQEVEDIKEALKLQENFKKEPFKTVVIDDKNPDQVHELDDFKNTYEGTSEFELDPKLIPNIVGDGKIEIKNGKVVIDSKKANDTLFSMTAFGLGVCGYMFPFGILIGIPMLSVAAVGAVVAPLHRAIKRFRINHLNPDRIVNKIRKRGQKHCKRNIRKYDRELKREIKRARKLSDPEYKAKVEKLKHDYWHKCEKEIGGLQFSSKGQLNIPFDLNQNTKVTNANVLGLAVARRRERKFKKGNKKALSTSKKAYRKDQHFEKGEKINKELYKEWKATRKSSERIEQYGSLKQKINLFKQSDEYRGEPSLKKRRKMVNDRRKELLAPARVSTAMQLGEDVDKNGKPKYETKSNMVYAHMKEFVEAVEDGKRTPRFRFGKKAKKAAEAVSADFTEMVSQKVEHDEERRRAYDTKQGQKALGRVEERLKTTQSIVEEVKNEAATLEEKNDFEKSFIAQARSSKIKKEVELESREIESLANRAPFGELNSSQKQDIQSAVDNSRVDASVASKKAQQACKMQRAKYERDVEHWAMADFVAAHSKEFETFIKVENAKGHTNVPKDVQITQFASYLKTIHPDKKESINNELFVYKTKNDIESRVQAEVVCEQEQDKYQEWLSKHPKMNPDSEIAKCAYYAHRVKADITVANQFKLGSGKFKASAYKACQEKVEELFSAEQKQMETSQEKQEKYENVVNMVEEKRKEAIEQKEEERKKEERRKINRTSILDRAKATVRSKGGLTA